ncbi:unnamed protein product [Prorocentrum cordatum]|uniref:Tryptophan synthase beta chain-like PALP domain-containing protein n=1 Tax=Prorocentrum cordatum TaxID=2364126 RepID=A0ABN9QRH5_9DINO|nr:unnamed protein product [Polarella glacialis]|mmetsp:Transcript_73440/g.191611  ORF Transcript_73440/g.191611 Transcript_73440/m.191611 type:complete len:416 (-) Transcript_73440:440-1687(-)
MLAEAPLGATAPFGPKTAKQVRRFFGSEPTPLVPLRKTAQELGLAAVYVKDESKRLGLQAFKVFGAAYGMATWLAREVGVDLASVTGLEELRRVYSEKGGKPRTFVTCTDGNHGRAVAWAAKHLGQCAVVLMPKGSAAARVEHVRDLGGQCDVTDLNYDQTVELAFQKAQENGWTVLQDTTAPGYTEIPTWIMQGYTAMADEALAQVDELDQSFPSHVVLQVGVGSMAGAVLGYLVERCSAAEGGGSAPRPVAITLEPQNAACAFASAEKGDGSAVTVDGDLDSMIAGLCCGVPSDIGWPILAKHVDGGFCWIGDGIAGNGMRAMKAEGVEAGECGGAGLGLIRRIMAPDCPKAASVRERLQLGSASRVLIFNTEGATDPENYAKQMGLPDVPPMASPADFGFAPPLQVRACAGE